MIEQLKITYTNYRWAKLAVIVVLLLCSVLLLWTSGGFPPWAWRFLFQVVPQVPRLWSAQGAAIVIPLVGLILLSVSLLLLWGILLITIVNVAVQWWRDFHERQHFAMDLRAAELLVEQTTIPDGGQVRQAPPVIAQQPQRMAINAPRASEQIYGVERSARITRNTLSSTGTSPTFSLPATHPHTPRRVHIPPPRPAPSMRDQLRIVNPANDDNASYDFDDELDDDMPDTWPEQDALQDPDALIEDDVQDEQDQYDMVEDDEQDRYDMGEDDQDQWEQDDELEIDQCATLPSIKAVQPKRSVPPTGQLSLVVGVGLDPGLLRKDSPNEDSLCSVQGTRVTDAGPEAVGLFVVADGLGGHAHGQDASRLAIQAMSDIIVPVLLHGGTEEENFLDLLKDGVHRANLAIYRRNRQEEQAMGTTLTAALVVHTTAYIANVGDSRTYLYRASAGLEPVTRDHSIVARLVENGVISREEVYTHPKRNQIYRCLGEHATVEVDTFVVTLQAGDMLLLCSDGLWEMVRDEAMSKIIDSSLSHPSQISAKLIQAALNQGGVDNISVVAVGVAEIDAK